VRDLTRLRHVLPVHQGRAAESIISRVLGGPGKIFLANAHFDTTRANILAVGGRAFDLPVPEALLLDVPAPFKGDIDLRALERKIREVGAANVAIIIMTLTNNTLGGQPVALSNLRGAREIARHHQIPLFLDAARFAENAWFIKQREFAHASRTPREIARDLFAQCDGCWVSAKKDNCANIGGFLALNDDALAQKFREEMMMTEGYSTYGGLAGRDLEAIAVGLHEALDERSLAYRIKSLELLASGLKSAGIPILEPAGGHAVVIDARRLLPHISPGGCAAQSLACELYLAAGVRTMSMGHDDGLLRLAMTRRAYTRSHIDFVVEVISHVAAQAGSIRQLRSIDSSRMAS
jgi:tryptophanase